MSKSDRALVGQRVGQRGQDRNNFSTLEYFCTVTEFISHDTRKPAPTKKFRREVPERCRQESLPPMVSIHCLIKGTRRAQIRRFFSALLTCGATSVVIGLVAAWQCAISPKLRSFKIKSSAAPIVPLANCWSGSNVPIALHVVRSVALLLKVCCRVFLFWIFLRRWHAPMHACLAPCPATRRRPCKTR